MTNFSKLVEQCRPVLWIKSGPNDTLELIELAPGELDAVASRADFVGLAGFCGIVPRVALAVELDDASVKALAQSLVRISEMAITRLENGKHANRAMRWSELT